MRRQIFILFIGLYNTLYAQTYGTLQGKITDEHGAAISYVTVICNETSTLSREDGSYAIKIPLGDQIQVYFSKIGYKDLTENITPVKSRTSLSPVLKINSVDIPKVHISYDKESEENVTHLSAEKATSMAGLSLSGIEGGLRTFAGVTTKSELSSQYSVRGGSYDENLVYVNGVPAFKPTMARSDKQEGLSIINPYMVESVDFSSGGFDICYGDKMSSVLNVTYKDIDQFKLQTDVSFMDANVTVQGCDSAQKLSILTGLRYKNTSLVLKTLDESGEYKPIFYDIQSLLKYRINAKTTLSYWIYGANNTYSFLPDKRVTDFGNQMKSYRMTIYFEGEEKYTYRNIGNSLSLQYRPTNKSILDFKILYYAAEEDENFDVLSQYRLSESYNNGDHIVEDSTAILAVGSFMEHGRNALQTRNITCMHDGKQILGNVILSWGISNSLSNYDARYNEWTFIDSANYVLPYNDTTIILKNTANSKITHRQNITALYAGISKRLYFNNNAGSTLKINAGIRGTLDSYSGQFLCNPRMRILFQPNKDKSGKLSFASGIYCQPAEFKELVDKEGIFHSNVKPQKSVHFVTGYTQTLHIWDRPFIWHSEIYAKLLKDIIPYTIDNVTITYYPELIANGYITGVDSKLNGEFVPGVESWINISLMRAREHLQNNTSNEIRRANDQLLNYSMYFQDFLPGSERLKMNLTFMVGTNIPTASPTATYTEFDDYKISSYTRLDIGFLILLLNPDRTKRKQLQRVQNMTLGLEIFNLFDNANKISYFWIEDVSNSLYAVPNYLTSRRVNVKLSISL